GRLRVGARFQFSDLGRQRGDLGLEFGDLALLRRLRRSGETGGAERGGERCGEDRMAHEGFLGYAMGGAEATPADWHLPDCRRTGDVDGVPVGRGREWGGCMTVR